MFDRAIQPVLMAYMNRQFRNTLETMKELIVVEVLAERDAPTA